MVSGIEAAPIDLPSESIQPNASHEGLVTSEYLSDELPSIKDLSADFVYLLGDNHYIKDRLKMAGEYAEHLKARFKPGEYALADYEYPKSQILPRLFIDSLAMTTRRHQYQSLRKGARQTKSTNTLPALQNLIGAKIDLQCDITEYKYLNPDTTNMNLYGNLALIMHHSRRVLYGDEVTEEHAKQKNLSQLTGILAEYKVLSTLLEDWPLATFGSIEHDKNGTDIVVPSRKHPLRGVVLQIKSSRNPGTKLEISGRGVEVPVLLVPMDLSRHDPLKLSEEDSEILRKHVKTAPLHNLAIAA